MGVILNENGKVIRVYSGKNQGSADDRLLIQADLAEKGDTQVIEQRQHAGFSSRPPVDNERLFVTRINNSYLVSLAEEDGILNDDLSAGETRVYSSESGALKARLDLKNSGKCALGNGTDELVSLLDEILTELQKTVDLPGAASTGTLFKINTALADIQARLGNIKV